MLAHYNIMMVAGYFLEFLSYKNRNQKKESRWKQQTIFIIWKVLVIL